MAGQWMDSRQFSSKINEVLKHVGVKDEIVNFRRNCYLQMECNTTVQLLQHLDVFNLGSQSEGSTTIGINSDLDIAIIYNNIVVVTDASDHVSDDIVYKFQMDKFTEQGYCLIKDISYNVGNHNLSFQKHHKPTTTYMINSLNSFLDDEETEIEGPAAYIDGELNHDFNFLPCAFYCTSWPLEVTNMFQLNQTKRHWPSERLLHNILESRCFVVPKGSDIGPDSDIEWRLSFSFAERLLMFDLNIIQIRCYILMKYVKSTFLDNLPGCKGVISSYICKTALFHTVSQTFKNDWVAEELLNNFNKCLHTLRQFIDKGNCPHFIMPMNNLLSNKLDKTKQTNISMELQRIIESNGNVLFDIKFDKFGELIRDEEANLQVCDAKSIQNIVLNRLIEDFGFLKLQFVNDLCLLDLGRRSVSKACSPSSNQASIGLGLDDPVDIDDKYEACNWAITTLKGFKKLCDSTPVTEVRIHEAIKVWEGICNTSIGSLQASADIKHNHKVSSGTLLWLKQGMECTQVASAHLKLASVLFLVGDLDATKTLLNEISKMLDKRHIVHVCFCRIEDIETANSEDIPAKLLHKIYTMKPFFADMVRENVADCVVYTFDEINSCPKELQYEMYRVIFNEEPYFFESLWYVAAVPQVPYLFFLQYKLYKQLGMIEQCRQSLTVLKCTLITDMYHQDTVCNLIGQCLELEGEYIRALKYYCLSLEIVPVYNAAKILICCNLFEQFQLRNHHNS